MFVLEILYPDPGSIVSGRKSLSRKADGQRYWDVRDNGILSLVLDNFSTQLENSSNHLNINININIIIVIIMFYSFHENSLPWPSLVSQLRMHFLLIKTENSIKGVKRKRIKHILNSFWKHYFLKSFDINLCKNSGIHLRFHPFSGFTLICFC